PDAPGSAVLRGLTDDVRVHVRRARRAGGHRDGEGHRAGSRDHGRDAAVLHRAEALELPGLDPAGRILRARKGPAAALVPRGLGAAPLMAALAAGPAGAATTTASVAGSTSPAITTGTTSTAAPGTPVLVTSQNVPPAGFRLTAAKVEKIAARVPKIAAT